MKARKKSGIRKRLINAYFTTGLSISLVLFLLGCLGLMMLNAKQLSDYVRENIGFTLMIDDQAREAEVIHLQRSIKAAGYAKSTRYVDKDIAAKELQNDLGEDFVGFIGYNPLLSSIDVKLKSEYMHPDSLAILEHKFLDNQIVNEVYYQRDLVALINDNLNKIGGFLGVACIVLLLISVSLISNTIRLLVYADRVLIHTMQLVGATRSFIRRPFIYRTIILGLIGGLVANGTIAFIVLKYQNQLSAIALGDTRQLGLLFSFVFLSAIAITWISTTRAVNRYLHSSFDELF